jgi:hypothetical protein
MIPIWRARVAWLLALIRRTALDLWIFAPRMRAPMHSNYQFTFSREAHAALPQWSILSNRLAAPACARDERDFANSG